MNTFTPFDLTAIGWNSEISAYFDELKKPNYLPARISSEDRGSYQLIIQGNEVRGKISGLFRYSTSSQPDFPVVGDWVAVELHSKDSTAIIHKLLPRKSLLLRKIPGNNTVEQALVANIDYAFIISALNHDFNLRRIERYLTLAWSSGASPIIVLNKVDLIKTTLELQQIQNRIATIALGVPIHFISLVTKQGLSELNGYFKQNKTIALLGSSGVGKSTLTNYLLGTEQQKIADIRATDSKGRHTTTRRQLFLLSNGGVIVDTPGIRELQLWTDQDSFRQSFSDIEVIAQNCRFRDCTHTHEPGCAVQSAIANSEFDNTRLRSYQKLQREAKHLARKSREAAWDSRLESRKFGKLRHAIIRDKKNIKLMI